MNKYFFIKHLSFDKYFLNKFRVSTDGRTKLAYRGRLNSMNKWPMMNRQLGGVSEQVALHCQ